LASEAIRAEYRERETQTVENRIEEEEVHGDEINLQFFLSLSLLSVRSSLWPLRGSSENTAKKEKLTDWMEKE
jgi:hypothetical protein